MGTVSRLPEKIRITIPTIASEAEAFDGIHTLIRHLSSASDNYLHFDRAVAPLIPAIAGSGLLGITTPPEWGGADISNIVLAKIMASAAAASRMAAACLASHFCSIELLRGSPSAGSSGYFYSRAMAGDLFLMTGGMDSTLDDTGARLQPETGKPGWRLNGNLEASIDPIHADWIVLKASAEDREHAVFIPRMTAGLRLTPERASFSNVHIDADCFVPLARPAISTAAPLYDLLQAAQRLGWANRKLYDRVAMHSSPSAPQGAFGQGYLSTLGLIVSRIENGKAALERAGRKIDAAQVNTDSDTTERASFLSAIALSSAAEAFDLAGEIGDDHQPTACEVDLYGHAPLGARLLENRIN